MMILMDNILYALCIKKKCDGGAGSEDVYLSCRNLWAA
jgi:hypothetical protein